MMLNKKEFKINFAGQPVSISFSKLAEQATSAAVGQHGDTTVLVTATMGKEDRDIGYFPLVIDYEEKFYAAGKIIGSRFIRREGRPSEEAILSGRLIDRSLRPFFDERLRRDVQVIITVLSYDEENDPEFISLLTASTVLASSEIPWSGPVSGVRITKTKDGKIIINPKNSELKGETSTLFEAFVAGTRNKISMIELEGRETSEDDIIESFESAEKSIKELIDFQNKIVEEIGRPKIEYKIREESAELNEKIRHFLNGRLDEAVYSKDKIERLNKIEELRENLREYLTEEGVADPRIINSALEEEISILVRKNILEHEKRPDGRKIDEVRDLYAEVGLFKRLHGSAIFARGNTQALAAVTLAAPGAEQLIETMEVSGKRRFMLHYNFPPYSTGEIGRLGAPGRREIGHGALAEKALRSLIPPQEEFPYTIRVVSEILSSNGSSSMASVSASALALMDAGVPIKRPTAGIAMGLVAEKEAGGKEIARYKILTDIQGPEDHHGDMDLKVAGTENGVTAIQMDVKIKGLTLKILNEVLERAKGARHQILKFMSGVIAKPRPKVSDYAPVIMVYNIRPDQIGEVIGPGGKVINGIIQKTGVLSIDIEQTGKVFVAGQTQAAVQSAVDEIKALTRDFQIGEIVKGEVIKILDFGAIVDLGGGKDGMIHVSELKNGFVEKVADVVKIGDKVEVKVIRVEDGRIGLSLKAARSNR